MSYTFLDASGSVQTANSSVVAGVIQNPIVTIASILTPITALISGTPSISGAVTVVGTPSVSGSVGIIGTVTIASIVATYAEDSPSTGGDSGLLILGVRNDAVASLVSANGDYGAFSQDSAGRQIMKPFAPEEARIDMQTSIVSGSVTALFNSVVGLRQYVTDIMVANTGSVATLVTFKDGSTSILGYTIAPAGGGSNIVGMGIPFRTAPAQDFTFSVNPPTSVLYMTAKGYKAP